MENEPKIEDPYRQVQTKDFSAWLRSHLLTMQYKDKYGDIKRIVLPRNIFITRLSSSFGGSHPKGTARDTQENNLIELLCSRHIGGFPVAYIIAYAIACEIAQTLAPDLVSFLNFPKTVEPE